jgi:putative transcriptional regulator
MSPARPRADDEAPHRVVCHLDRLLEERGMTLTELAERVGVSVVNLSVLKNNRARAIRFSTLTAVCDVLGCQPGDVLAVPPDRATRRPSLRLRDRGR